MRLLSSPIVLRNMEQNLAFDRDRIARGEYEGPEEYLEVQERQIEEARGRLRAINEQLDAQPEQSAAP